MKYKIVGYLVWQTGTWYLRRRLRGAGTKLAVAGGAGLLLAGGAAAVAAQRRVNGS